MENNINFLSMIKLDITIMCLYFNLNNINLNKWFYIKIDMVH